MDKNMCVMVGALSEVKLNSYKLGVRGYVKVGEKKCRVDMRKLMGNGEVWSGYEAMLANFVEGKRVVCRGHVEDGSWATEAGDLRTGNRFVIDACLPAPEDAGEDRILMKLNAIWHGGKLYYSKFLGQGVLKMFGKVHDEVGVVEDELLSVVVKWTMTVDEWGFSRQKMSIVDVNDAAEDDYNMPDVCAIAEYDAARPAYEQKLREDAKQSAAYKRAKAEAEAEAEAENGAYDF